MKKKFSWWKLGLIVLPFLILIIWILSGLFKPSDEKIAQNGGFNTQLPSPNITKDSTSDKLSFYAVAKADSIKKREELQMDPYRVKNVKVDRLSYSASPVIEEEAYSPVFDKKSWVEEKQEGVVIPDQKVVKIVDPELDAINATLDKLKELQQPSLQESKPHPFVRKEQALGVSIPDKNTATYFGKDRLTQSVFYDDLSSAAEPGQGIRATIPYGQVVQQGSTVRVELRSPIQISGSQVPAGTVLSGVASLNAERLHIQIPSIRIAQQVFKVILTVYDMDGLEGIYVPGSITRDVVKESADGAVQSIGVSGFDASVKTQVMSAGIGAVKGLVSRKVKAIRVNLPTGYPILLIAKNSGE
ncbi:MAG TPA: hypothetical protein DHW64_10345 [Chitinophagaceae bacterium]|nr:hypothetical protein [Chitinophagaceae bacterium]